MKQFLKFFFLWIFFAPALYSKREMGHKFLRLLFVIFSPFSLFVFLFCIVPIIGVISISMAPIMDSFQVEHHFKNAEDIAEVTSSYIPPCDTLKAVYYSVGIDGTVEETFRLQHELTERETKIFRKCLKNEKYWAETDSTFVYNDMENIVAGKSKHGYDALTVTIPKKGRTLLMRCSYY